MGSAEAVRFIVANYGSRHAGMLLAHLHSVTRTHPDASITVYWQDIPQPLRDVLPLVAPRADFVQTDFDFDRDALQRISSKVLCWARGAEEHATEAEALSSVKTTVQGADTVVSVITMAAADAAAAAQRVLAVMTSLLRVSRTLY